MVWLIMVEANWLNNIWGLGSWVLVSSNLWSCLRYHYIDIIPSPGNETWGVEFSFVLDMVVSVAGAPWKKEEGSMVKPRCDVCGCSTLLEELYNETPLWCAWVLHTVGATVTRKPVANGMLRCMTSWTSCPEVAWTQSDS